MKGFILLLLGASSVTASVTSPPAAIKSVPIRRSISRGETHRYRMTLQSGEFVRLALTQLDIDLALLVSGPGRNPEIRFGGGEWGTDHFGLLAPQSGEYSIGIEADAETSRRGTYTIHISERRKGTRSDIERFQLQRQIVEANSLAECERIAPLRVAADAAHRIGDAILEAQALRPLSQSLHRQAHYDESIAFENRLLTLYSRNHQWLRQGMSYRELSRLYGQVGDRRRSKQAMLSAYQRYRSSPDLRAQAIVFDHLATVARNEGRGKSAVSLQRRAVRIYEQLDDRRQMMSALQTLVGVHLHFGEHESAIETAEENLAIRLERSSAKDQMAGLSTIAYVLLHSGRPADCISYFRQAAAIARMVDEPSAEAEDYEHLAHAEWRLGHLASGARHARFSARLWEEVRERNHKPVWKAGLMKATDRLAQLLMADWRENGNSDQAKDAFLAVDRARARYIVEDVEAYAHIRDRLVDSGTILLSYHVGDDQTFLWIIRPEGFETHLLPGHQALRPLSARVHRSLTTSRHRLPAESLVKYRARLGDLDEDFQAAQDLSGILLGPVRDLSKFRRILISSNTYLQYIPFASLPDPQGNGQRLIDTHEVISLPSASVAATLRRDRSERRPHSNKVAVVADPVYERDDPRLSSAEPRQRSADAVASGERGERLRRLIFSQLEAGSVTALAPQSECFCGRNANPEILRDLQAAPPRILHFATHALSDSDSPEKSGLALSSVGPSGEPVDGLLTFPAIYDAKLPVDLVVLGGCDTAVGKDFFSEGMVTLAGAFLHAGARSVIASLWRVDDEATAQLMKLFYEELFKNRKPPGQALRAAQLRMASVPRWSSPYYWAGFQLQGEWQ